LQSTRKVVSDSRIGGRIVEGESKRRKEIEDVFGRGKALNLLARSVCKSDIDVKIGSPQVDVLILQLFGGLGKSPYPGMCIRGDLDILLYDPSPDTLVLANRIWSLAPKWRYVDLRGMHPEQIASTLASQGSAMGDGLMVIDNFSFIEHMEPLRYWLNDIRFEGHPSFKSGVAHLVMARSAYEGEILGDPSALSSEFHRGFDIVMCEKQDEQSINDRIRSIVDIFTDRAEGDELLHKLEDFSLDDAGLEDVTFDLVSDYISHARTAYAPKFAKKDREALLKECESVLLTLRSGLKEALVSTVIKLTEAIARVNMHPKVAQEDIQLAVILASWHLLNEQARFSRDAEAGREAYAPPPPYEADVEEDYDGEEPGPTWESFRPVQPVYTFDDIVLSERNRREIEELLCEIKYNDIIYERWKLKETMKRRRGTKILFIGYPGTGKSVTAEAIANVLGKQVIMINYSELEDKYVGETEKNIAAAFEAARRTGAILMFDEADAVLYQRSTAERSFSNRDVSVLLREIEMFEGILILTSNLSMLMDTAAKRRIDSIIEFEFPDERTREKIWRKKLSPGVPVAKDADVHSLAMRYPLTGGQIENVIRSAVRHSLARAGSPDSAVVTLSDFESAARKEMEKDERLIKDHLTRSKHVRGYG